MRSEHWKRVREVFLSAVELPLDERDAFLARECGGDAELLLEVRRLLGSGTTEGFLEPPPAEQVSARLGEVTHPGPGRELGGYRLEEEVGASKAQEAIAGADRAIAGFVTPGLAKLLEETGLRNSPDVIKSFAAISAVIGEDSIPKHGASPSDTNNRDQKLAEMYPSMKK